MVDGECQPKEGLEEINGENLVESKRVLREGKGRKSAELIKNCLEDLLEIDQVYKDLLEVNQMHKMASEDTKDGRMFRKTETKIEKRLREGIT